jgi:hypothetical protein
LAPLSASPVRCHPPRLPRGRVLLNQQVAMMLRSSCMHCPTSSRMPPPSLSPPSLCSSRLSSLGLLQCRRNNDNINGIKIRIGCGQQWWSCDDGNVTSKGGQGGDAVKPPTTTTPWPRVGREEERNDNYDNYYNNDDDNKDDNDGVARQWQRGGHKKGVNFQAYVKKRQHWPKGVLATTSMNTSGELRWAVARCLSRSLTVSASLSIAAGMRIGSQI